MRERDTTEPEATAGIEPTSARSDSQNVPRGGPIYELLGFGSAEFAAAELWKKLTHPE